MSDPNGSANVEALKPSATVRRIVSVRRHMPNPYDAASWVVAVTHNPQEKRGILVSLDRFSSLDMALRFAAEATQELAG